MRINSDTFGTLNLHTKSSEVVSHDVSSLNRQAATPERWQPKNEEEAQLEDKNLRHACGEMQKHLDGSVALDFPVSAFVSPKPDQLSDFVKIDEKACLDYRDDAGAAKLAARRAAAAHAIRRVAPARGAASA